MADTLALLVCPETARSDLTELLPRFAREYTIRPWELIELSANELLAFLADIQERDDAAAKEQAQAQAQLRELEAMRGR